MSNKKNTFIGLSILLFLTVVVVILASWFASQYSAQQYANKHDGCMSNTPNHKVIIQNDIAKPAHIDGNRCDTLTITNLDETNRLMAFGLHEDHVPYDGVGEKALAQGQSFTVTMIQKGNFRFHDHIHDEVQATFTVK